MKTDPVTLPSVSPSSRDNKALQEVLGDFWQRLAVYQIVDQFTARAVAAALSQAARNCEEQAAYFDTVTAPGMAVASRKCAEYVRSLIPKGEANG